MHKCSRFNVGQFLRNSADFSKGHPLKISESIRRILVVCITGSLLILTTVGCNHNPGVAGGTTETTSATICGTMFNDDGSKAKDATVRFVPADFNAYSAADTAVIESTQTDNNGRYAFTLEASGYYNVYAHKDDANAFEDSVYVSTNEPTRVDDTLKAPGSISGVVKLGTGDDNEQIIILVLGTNTYTVPKDTSGTFCIPGLAEGDYVLRFLTINPDYGYTDTVISVVSGQNSAIGRVIHLPYEGVPEVGLLKINYDSSSMFATLTWPEADTTKVAGFYIYENPSYSVKPLAVVDNTDTWFRADAILFSGYAYPISYSVAAVDKDRRVGKLSTTSAFYAKNMLRALDTVICEPKTKNSVAAVCQAGGTTSVILGGPGWLARYDMSGTRVKEYVNTDHYGSTAVDGNTRFAPVAYSYIAADSSGNVFAIETYKSSSKTTDSATLTFFSPDLEPGATVPVGVYPDSGNEKVFPFKVATAPGNKGYIHLFYTWDDGSSTGKTVVKSYDAALTEKGVVTIPEHSASPELLNDTVYCAGTGSNCKDIISYDLTGNKIAEWNIAAMKTGEYPVIPVDTVKKVFRLASGAMLACIEERGVVLIDRDFNLVGRCRINIHADIIGTNGVDRIYVSDNSLNATTPSVNTNIVVYRVR